MFFLHYRHFPQSRPAAPSRAQLLSPFLVALLALGGCGDSEASSQEAPGGEPDVAAATEDRQVIDLTRVGHEEGDPEEAVLRVIEFSDYGCVHCANFHLESYPELYEEFIATGEVAWKYVPITIGGFPNGDAAALAGECAAEQGEWPAMRDRIFELREQWMQSGNAEGLLEDAAGAVGLDVAEFRSCVASSEEVRSRLAEGNQIAEQIGVRATPTFIVGGQPVQGAPSLEAFQEGLRQMIEDRRAEGGR
jgi:hypothetical protein